MATGQPLGPEVVAALNAAMKDPANQRRLKFIGTNPSGVVFLGLDDGSVVGLSQREIAMIVSVHGEGLKEGQMIAEARRN